MIYSEVFVLLMLKRSKNLIYLCIYEATGKKEEVKVVVE